MTAITIPKTIEEATTEVVGIGALVTAKQWHLAAIVYAFTEPGKSGPRTSLNSTRTSYIEFARRSGLDQHTVARYRTAWQDAILDGQATPVEPGEKIEMPERSFPEHPGSAGGTTRSVRAALKAGTVTIADVIGDDDEMLETVTDQIAANPVVAGRVERKVEQRRRESRIYEAPDKEPVPAEISQRVYDDLRGFWTHSVGEIGTREDVLRVIAANRNSPSLGRFSSAHTVVGEIVKQLRSHAAKATEMADLMESATALEVTA